MFVVCCWLVGCLLCSHCLVGVCSLFARWLSFVACRSLLSVVRCLMVGACCSLFVVRCSLFVVR